MDTEISKNGVLSHSDGCESGAKIFREGGEVTFVMGKGAQVRTPRELQFDWLVQQLQMWPGSR